MHFLHSQTMSSVCLLVNRIDGYVFKLVQLGPRGAQPQQLRVQELPEAAVLADGAFKEERQEDDVDKAKRARTELTSSPATLLKVKKNFCLLYFLQGMEKNFCLILVNLKVSILTDNNENL